MRNSILISCKTIIFTEAVQFIEIAKGRHILLVMEAIKIPFQEDNIYISIKIRLSFCRFLIREKNLDLVAH